MRQPRSTKKGGSGMYGRLLSKEETNAALVLALGGMIMLLVANGPGPVSLGRTVSGALFNPVPGTSRRTSSDAALPPLRSEIAA